MLTERISYAAGEDAVYIPSPAAPAPLSARLHGTNLEHTRSCMFHGLCAEMLRNRKFSGKPACGRGIASEWFPIGEHSFFTFDDHSYAHHAESAYRMHRGLETHTQRVYNFEAGATVGLGQYGLSVRAGETYDFAAVARGNITAVSVALTDRVGEKTYAEAVISLSGEPLTRYSTTFTPVAADGFTRLSVTLTPTETDEDAAIRLSFREGGWVDFGALSLMPADNFRGMRRDVIERLRELGPGILRWPGGNFAGEYCWLDGFLPRDERAPCESYLRLETQPHTLGYDGNELNTDDFMALCELVGAEPYITLNTTWCTPEENAAWVEYCNGAPDTPYGKMRADRGHPAPYHVKLWTLGNEAGYPHMEGESTAAGYLKVATANAEAIKKVDPGVLLCASGPYPDGAWAKEALLPMKDTVRFASLHHYPGVLDYAAADLAAEYAIHLDEVGDLLEKARVMQADIPGFLTSFDEWNIWYAWYRPSSVYEGIFSALAWHAFLANAEDLGIGICCQFEAVNEGLITVTPHGATLTAAGQAFSLMRCHTGGRITLSTPWLLATEKDGKTSVTFVNPSLTEPHTLTVPTENAEAVLYQGESILPFTRFDECKPTAEKKEGKTVYTVPPLSLLLVTF